MSKKKKTGTSKKRKKHLDRLNGTTPKTREQILSAQNRKKGSGGSSKNGSTKSSVWTVKKK